MNDESTNSIPNQCCRDNRSSHPDDFSIKCCGSGTRIGRVSDTSMTRYANLTLPSGEPVFISLTKNGAVVKKSKTGMFGKVLYRGNAQATAELCSFLDAMYGYTDVSSELKSPPLRVFVQAALHANDCEELNQILAS